MTAGVGRVLSSAAFRPVAVLSLTLSQSFLGFCHQHYWEEEEGEGSTWDLTSLPPALSPV